MNADEMFGVFENFYESSEYSESELVIGLVGAIGSRLNILTNILAAFLRERFHYDVEIVRVSKDIIYNYLDVSNSDQCEYAKYSTYMDKGNDLRKENGDKYLALEIAAKIFTIRQERQRLNKSKRVVYVVNSLKHDQEIKALRQIYSHGFFQISLYESKKRREDFLVNDKAMSNEQAAELISRDECETKSHGQHTSDAFHLADYFVQFDDSHDQFKESCLRFLNLIFGDPFITPTFNEFATFMAFTSSLRSADLSRQVGAVIAKDETILATGANDVPKFGGGLYWPIFDSETGKVLDVEHGRDYMKNEDPNAKEKERIVEELVGSLNQALDDSIVRKSDLSDFDLSTLKEKFLEVVKSSKIKDITEYGRVVHAEMEALLSCGRAGISTKNAILYATTFPCHNCAKHILASGIRKVIFVEPYPKSKALEFHEESISHGFEDYDFQDSENEKLIFEPFVGVGARSFLNLFSMSLGAGYELKRKIKTGSAVKWAPETAVLRTALLPLSYLDLEQKAMELIVKIKISK